MSNSNEPNAFTDDPDIQKLLDSFDPSPRPPARPLPRTSTLTLAGCATPYEVAVRCHAYAETLRLRSGLAEQEARSWAILALTHLRAQAAREAEALLNTAASRQILARTHATELWRAAQSVSGAVCDRQRQERPERRFLSHLLK